MIKNLIFDMGDVLIGYRWKEMLTEDFGVPEDERMDVTLTQIDEVVRLSEKVQDFCMAKGIDARRAYLAGLSMEEMAGNIVDHGFRKDSKKHSIDRDAAGGFCGHCESGGQPRFQ